MKYYSGHCGGAKNRVSYLEQKGIGCMISAADWRKPYSFFAVDNGAWTDYTHGTEFNHHRFISVLNKIWKEKLNPDFIVLPDVFGDGKKSLKLSESYMWITSLFPCYLPIQDSMTPSMVLKYVDNIKGVFIGGGDVWKYRHLSEWVSFAHNHDLKIHVGRVGTLRNIILCVEAGVDSVDGSALVRNGKYSTIPYYLNVAHNLQKHLISP